MLKRIGSGAEVFHKLIEENKYYVDKTPLIRTVFKDIASKTLLITRPEKFGKTLTLSTFYDFLALNPGNPEDVSRQENWFRDIFRQGVLPRLYGQISGDIPAA